MMARLQALYEAHDTRNSTPQQVHQGGIGNDQAHHHKATGAGHFDLGKAQDKSAQRHNANAHQERHQFDGKI